jgi:hypothetical protein
MCNCGCNTCETKTKGPLLTESKVKSLLSEGLQYHIDKKIPLFETVYRIGSDKHLALIKEARKMYSRNIIDLCEDDEALIKTHLGEFALYEGESVPLDLPMLNESDSNYPDFDLNKNIRYKDTSISSGMWRYTGQEQGGKGVYRNLNNDQILAFDRSDFDIFKNNLGSHFDISESLNEFSLPKFDVVKPIIDKFLGGIEKAGKKLLQIVKREGKQTLVLIKEIAEYVVSGEKPTSSEQKKITEQLKDLGFLAFLGIAGNIPFSLFSIIYFIIDESGIAKEFLKLNESLNEDEQLDEKKKAKKKEKKDPPLNKPKRGGSKAYYVYVRDPKTKKIKKVSFGSGGLRAKIKNKEARTAFAARHNCKNKKDRTKAGYWSCNLPRYAPALGLGAKMNTFW